MTQTPHIAACFGGELPDAFADVELYAYIDEGSEPPRYYPFGDFNLTDGEDVREYFSPWSQEHVAIFMGDGDGHHYGFWRQPDRALVDCPVVFLGNEGEQEVIAGDLDEFLALAAWGMTEYLCADGVTWMLEEGEPTGDPEPFFKEQGIKRCPDPARLIAEAAAAYPLPEGE